MNGSFYVLFFAVAIEIIWIITSAMRKKEEEVEQQRRLPRPDPFDRPRQRPMPTNVDRFLEEINRRRQEAAQRQGTTLQDRIDDAVQRRRQETGIPFPPPQQKPRPLAPVAEPPIRRVQVPSPVVGRPPVAPVIRDVRRISEPVLVVEAVEAAPTAKPARVTATSSVRRGLAQDDTFTPTEIRRAASPLRDKLIPLLRSRQALPLAVLLNEVFGQPVSKRPRRHYRSSASGHASPPGNSSSPTTG
jgi:hypothetical protein